MNRSSQNDSSNKFERIDSEDLDNILFDKDPKLLDAFNDRTKFKNEKTDMTEKSKTFNFQNYQKTITVTSMDLS